MAVVVQYSAVDDAVCHSMVWNGMIYFFCHTYLAESLVNCSTMQHSEGCDAGRGQDTSFLDKALGNITVVKHNLDLPTLL